MQRILVALEVREEKRLMLPTINIHGHEFYDISGIVTPDRFRRSVTDGLAIHHSVGQTTFPDRNANGTSQDEQVAHIQAINDFHIRQQYGGFGYNAIAFADGAVYVVGTGEGGRAHVANHNNHLEGICMAGTFSDVDPPVGLVLGVGRWLAAKRKQRGLVPVKGHRDWADPGWATSCPGDRGKAAIAKIAEVANALERGEEQRLIEEAKKEIAASLVPVAQRADLDTLSKQIAYLTGNRLCAVR